MLYTVNEVTKLSGVTIKTLYHYQKIGLLIPEKVGKNGYRYYSEKNLETLQQILFYRELDFPLNKIKAAMYDESSRLQCLHEQKSLLLDRQQRTHCILHTLNEAIRCTEKGVNMNQNQMFSGLNKQEWEEILSEQNQYLKEEYNYDLLNDGEVKPEELNRHSDQATKFMYYMADALKKGIRPDDSKVKERIKEHIEYINKELYPTNPETFFAECEFFLTDDFHRNMYENIQTGLSYYFFVAAKMYAMSS